MGARHSRGSDACPSSPEDITPQWLSTHAKLDATAVKVPKGGVKPARGRISRVSITPVTAEVYDGTVKSDGGGMSGSSLVRIHLYFEGFPADTTPPPKSLILKLSNFKKIRLLFQDRQLWFFAGAGPCQWEAMLAEAAFFSHQRELADAAGVRLPTTYCAMVSPARPKPPGKMAHFLFNARSPLRTALLLEDLSHLMTFPQSTVLPEAHAIAALCEIAKLHGHCWGRRDEWNGAHPDAPMRECYYYAKIALKVTDAGLAVPSRQWHCDRALATTLAQWGVEPLLIPEFADPKVVEALWHLRTISQSLHPEMYEGEGQTLLHGDFHGWNVMFSREPGALPADNLRLIDFAYVGYGRVAWELSYFLLQSCEPADLATTSRLLDAYYDALIAAAEANPHFEPKSCLSRADLERQVQMALCANIISACNAYCYGGPVTPATLRRLKAKDEKGDGIARLVCICTGRVLLWLKAAYEAGLLTVPARGSDSDRIPTPNGAHVPYDA